VGRGDRVGAAAAHRAREGVLAWRGTRRKDCIIMWQSYYTYMYMYVEIHVVKIPYSGKFSWVQFSQMASLQSLIFVDASDHAHYTLYNRTYFTGIILADSHLSAKNVKIGPHKNFPLY
jgi:hypothetical protein